jgi:3-isopropylmalate/(R)-2-methylmalate dehydratase small subunit
MYNCGLIAAELPGAVLEEIFGEFKGLQTTLGVDTEGGTLRFSADKKEKTFPFVLKDFERALVNAGGWVEYAAARY